MKRIVILGDGMADEPVEALGGKTPMQVAHTPYMDLLALKGKNGLLKTIPHGFSPGSEIANLSILGYDLPTVYEGRGVLEAASMGVEVLPGELCMRCNLVNLEGDRLKNHSAGHISTHEATKLIHFLDEKLGNESISFHPGVSYRHVLKIRGGSKMLRCTPPHDIPGQPFVPHLIHPENDDAKATAELLNRLIVKSRELLENHPVNQRRKTEGQDPANAIWPWSPGFRPIMKPLAELFPVGSGAVISAVDLIRGIGVYAGLEVIRVEGATGLHNTNYEGKAAAALAALKEHDFVYLHVEASDEAGHEGDVSLKVKTIEYLDTRIVKTIYEETATWQEPVTIAVLPDHPTPCNTRTHTNQPVPFLIYRRDMKADGVLTYDEFSAKGGSYGLLHGDGFMKALLD
jgi:2,3-bisphosphoglycerate-independent phosphoglycerate mutase